MKILIIGATGFIGKKLAAELVLAGHLVTGLTRNPALAGNQPAPGFTLKHWDGISPGVLQGLLEYQDGIVNLAGESIGGWVWTKNRKKKLISSRVGTGNIISDAITGMQIKPAFLIQGSASGFYGSIAEAVADEDVPLGKGFLADLADRWEASVSMLERIGVRTVLIRTGVVLGKDGGIMTQLLLPFRFYCGTIPGSGKQWVSWIHEEDLVRAICFLIANPQSFGPYNLSSPAPARMREIIKEIARALKRPAWLKIPGLLLKIALGEMASETILASQKIYPAKLKGQGFSFKYMSIGQAIANLISK
jgi:uncharacterized protein (TIGR01777 family)